MSAGVVLSLYDETGNAVMPWVKAGYTAYIVDMVHPIGVCERQPGLFTIRADLRFGWLPPRRVLDGLAFVHAFPPCDDVANSGNRWKRGKGLRALAKAIDMFATAAELIDWLDVPGYLENPVGSVSTYWRKSDYAFDPYQYTLLAPEDNYFKETRVWACGDFVMPPEQRDLTLAPPGSPDTSHGAIRGPGRKAQRDADGLVARRV